MLTRNKLQNYWETANSRGIWQWRRKAKRARVAGRSPYDRKYSVQFGYDIIFKYFSTILIYLFPFFSSLNIFLLTIFSIKMPLYFFGLFLFVSHFSCRNRQKFLYISTLGEYILHRNQGPIRLSDNSVKFCTQVSCEETSGDVWNWRFAWLQFQLFTVIFILTQR